MSHSIIPPSSAHIWGAPDGCTGWVTMSQQFPETEETPEAAEGTASHEIGAAIIAEAAQTGASMASKCFVGETASNGIVYTQEMFEGAKEYADDVISVMRSMGVFGGPGFGIEERVEMPEIHPESFGTPDMFLFDSHTMHLYVWDYKFGHAIVEVFENWQLTDYINGILRKLGINGALDQQITVHYRVAQPRAFHPDGIIREWVVKASDLRGHFNTLHDNAHKALGPGAFNNSGPHCRHCQARHGCNEALQAGLRLYEVAGQPIPVELPPDALGLQYSIVQRAIKQLEYIESGMSEQLKGVIRSGKNVQGWKIQEGKGRERWARPASEVIILGDMYALDLRKEPEAITPNKARKLGIDDAVIKAYSEVPRTGLKLVPDNGNKAKQVFKS